MRWYKHYSDDRQTPEAELIKSQFGAEGYGIYVCLREIVAQFVEKNNFSEWGLVHPLYTVQSLAKECSTTEIRLKEFLAFCDDKKILKQKRGRLFDPAILNRLDNFAERVQRGYEVSTKSVRSQYDIDEIRKEKKRKDEKRVQRETISPTATVLEIDEETRIAQERLLARREELGK